MKKALFFLGVILITSMTLQNVSAQSAHWWSSSLPDGSPVLDMETHGNQVAALGMRGLWFSTNSGNAWVKIPTPFTDDGYSAVDFDLLGNIYISANEYNNWLIMKTSNFGATWQTIDSMHHGYVMDICVLNGEITAVGGFGTSTTGYTSLARSSSDQGQTWQNRHFNGSCFLQIKASLYSNQLFSRTENGLWNLSLGTFIPAKDLVSSSFAFSLSGEITLIGRKATTPHDKRIYTSVNGGMDWMNTEVGYGDEGRFNDVAYTDEGIALIVGDDIGPHGRYGTVLMKKNESGASWESIFPDTTMTFFNAICTNSEYVFIGTQNGKIWRSDKRLTAINSNQSHIVSGYSLEQNYPNPFNPTTKIHFVLPRNSNVDLRVYDMTGKEVVVLVQGFKSAGNYAVDFSGPSLSSGTYLYILTCDGYSETKKMILLK